MVNPVQQVPVDAKSGPVDAKAEVTVVPGSVMAELPPIIPEAQIYQTYQQQGIDPNSFGAPSSEHSTPTAEAVPAEGMFFTPQEIQVLNAQPVPVAVDWSQVSGAPPPPPQQATTIVLQPSNGAMGIIPNAYTTAKIKSDSMKKGFKSCDPILDNKQEILKFFNQYNTRPRMMVMVEGSHSESRQVRDADGKGYHTETRHVTDFRYGVDISHFIYPYGKITTASDTSKTVDQMIDDFLEDDNKLKSLQLQKKVFWNYGLLCHMVYSYCRQLGWRRQLRVWTETYDKSIRICTESKMASVYDNCCCRCMMYVTIIPALVFCFYGSGHRERGLRSIFVIQHHPVQVFESIRPQIWVTGFRGCAIS